MKPKVFWYHDCRGSWCHAIVEWLTVECEHVNGIVYEIGRTEDTYNPAIVVIKADDPKLGWEVAGIETLNNWMRAFRSVLVIVTANEEGTFPVSLIKHPKMRMWIQTPTRAQRQWASCGFPWGWTPGFDGTRWQTMLPGYLSLEADRMLDFSFVGQVTHGWREACINAANRHLDRPNCILESHGFGRGLPKHLYFELLVNSKVVLCPCGPQTADTFRAWEALESGALPIVDRYNARDSVDEDYWEYIVGPNHPLKVIDTWDVGLGYGLEYYLENWRASQGMVLGWWEGKKRFWQEKFQTDLEMLRRA